MEVAVDKKTFFDNVWREANLAFSKVVDKVEEVSRASALRLKINSLKAQIRDLKMGIGDSVFIHRKDFESIDELNVLIGRIHKLEERIESKKKELADLKEK